tara:strand:- start:139 stop:588 length:450 start_codon:yes stop_codon:yes gene_type:complete
MEIILKKDVKGLGIAEDLVSVKSGYARNYLIPQGIAEAATAEAKIAWESRKEEREAKRAALVEEFKKSAAVLQAAKLTIGAKVGTTDKIFGSVSTHQLAENIQEQFSVTVDRKDIILPGGEIKTLGTYKAIIRLFEDIEAEMELEVVAE